MPNANNYTSGTVDGSLHFWRICLVSGTICEPAYALDHYAIHNQERMLVAQSSPESAVDVPRTPTNTLDIALSLKRHAFRSVGTRHSLPVPFVAILHPGKSDRSPSPSSKRLLAATYVVLTS